MLKDFFRNMFTEEDEDWEEEAEEEEEIAAPEPVQQARVQRMPVTSDELYMEPEIQGRGSYLQDAGSKETGKDEKAAFTGLSVDDLNQESAKPKKKAGTQTYHYDRKKLQKGRPARQETSSDYQAVISPIFGNMEETQKEFDKVHNAIDLPKPADDFVFVQIISPMYGNDLPSSKPVESIPSYQNREERRGHKGARKSGRSVSLDLSEMVEKGAEGQDDDSGRGKGSR